MKYELVIFDLDGTVLNTLNDLANAVNHALEVFGHPTHSVEAIRGFIGNGVANLIRRACPAETGAEECDQILAEFKAYYREHVNDFTRPYPGIADLLRSLRAKGIRVGINSNKYDLALQKLCRAHFDGLFDYALGESEITPKKPDPTAALRIMQEYHVLPENTLYVGDSGVDIDTARNAGIDSAWVSWGFRRENEMRGYTIEKRFDTVEALQNYLLS